MEFRVLGPLEVALPGRVIRPRGQLGRLLVSLLGEADRPVSIDRLVDDLWGLDDPPPTARTAVHVHISKLRRLLGEASADGAIIETAGSGYVLRLGAAELDATTFRSWLTEGRELLQKGVAQLASDRLAAALAIWRGAALAGHESDRNAATWAIELEGLRHQAEEELVTAAIAVDATEAVGRARRLVTEEPLRERRWELLMLALYRSGRQAEALRAYQEARSVLLDQVGIEPGRELQLLEHAILVQDPALDGDRMGSVRPPPPRIPGALTPLIDREDERQGITDQLETHRVVTMWGPPGVGKTRLAFQVAADLAERFVDGVWVVELASVDDPSLVATRVANALGVMAADEVDGVAPEDLLEQHLAGRDVLLVLDNCEQVLASCAELVHRLCRTNPSLRVLATSRAPLGVAGEAVAGLRPFEVPPVGASGVDLEGHPAACFFAACVRATAPGFELDDNVAADVVRICRRVDGLPLALELVAAWARVLSIGQIADELDERLLPLVATPGSTTDGRYVTMAATIGAAYHRLDANERELFRGLAPFVGGFDLDAVNAIVGRTDGLLRLARLVETSLVDQIGPGRYRMLEPIRQYALTALAEAGETVLGHRDHAAFYRDLAERADALLHGPDQVEWLDRLETDNDNLRAAVGWALEHDHELALRLVVGLRWFWYIRGHWIEAVRWFDDVLAAADAGQPSTLLVQAMVERVEGSVTFAAMADNLPLAERALAMAREVAPPTVVANACLVVAIGLGWIGSELDRAERLMGEALFLAAHDDCRWAESWITRFQGLLLLRQGEVAKAYEVQQQALAIAEQIGDEYSAGHGLVFLGRTAIFLGDLERARANLAEGARRCQAIGAVTGVHGTLGLAQVEQTLGEHDRAAAHFREAIAVTERIGDLGCSAVAWRGLGAIARSDGDLDIALAYLRRALAIFARLGQESDIAATLVDVAEVAATAGDHELGVRLVGTALAHDHGSGTPLSPADVAAANQLLTTAAETLGERDRDREVDAGRRLTLDQAVAEALDPAILRARTPVPEARSA